jgi:hypothetical protein
LTGSGRVVHSREKAMARDLISFHESGIAKEWQLSLFKVERSSSAKA